jgi:general secretion pathway protein B
LTVAPPTRRAESARPARTASTPGSAATRQDKGSKPRIERASIEPSAETRVYAQAELPDDIRRQLPSLAIGGSIHSASAANRMLIINGQVFHEGGEPAPGLVLEQIKLKTAVLRFQGYRYEIRY